MRYISIDIETTGLNPETCQILSIGAIIEDTLNQLPFDELPKFHGVIKREHVSGSLFALNMNRDLIETIVQYSTAQDQDEKNDIVHMTRMQFYHEDEIVEAFYEFLFINGIVDNADFTGPHKLGRSGKTVPALSSRMKPVTITCAGKNFATFDKLFLERLPRWKQAIRIKQRVLDPAILYVDWKEDTEVPNLNICKERAGIQGLVTHNALEDAWDVIEVLRKKY
jgi:oligoribonuclease